MTNQSTIAVLSNGTRVAQLKSDAKRLEREQGISHSEALAGIAREAGYDNWEDLVASSWTVDDDGDILTQQRFSLSGLDIELPVVSEALPAREWDYWAEEGVEDMLSVDVELRFYSDTSDPYLYVSFVNINDGTNMELDEEMIERIQDAVESGALSDRVAVQGALVEEAMSFYEAGWVEMTAHDVCELERQRLGISSEDLVWEEPGVGGYGPNGWAVRVYRAAEDQLLVCSESDSRYAGEEVFGMISEEQFDAVDDNPSNCREMMYGFLTAAGMNEHESDSEMHD